MSNLRLPGASIAMPLLVLASMACGGASADDKQSAAATVEASATSASTGAAVASTATPVTADGPGVATPAAAAATSTAVVSVATPTVAGRQTPAGNQATFTAVPASPTLAAGTQAVPAPIDGLEVRTLASSPPRYEVNIKAGLPSGCAKRYTNSVERNGNSFRVTVLNALPTGQAVCTMIYGIYELNLTLPGRFVSGEIYTVEVNDKKTTFRAQ